MTSQKHLLQESRELESPEAVEDYDNSARQMWTTGIQIQEHGLSTTPQFIKRIFDLVIILSTGLITLPVIGIIAVFIKASSPGPAFYWHTRTGRCGKPFAMCKFRSMVVDAEDKLESYLKLHPEFREEWERSHKLRNDPRVTGIGRILRKTSLDELPQLFNVIRGEMSLVGPRPLPEYHLNDYSKLFQEIRTRVLPGMTGLWQISGRSEEITQLEHCDKYYISHWSPGLDLYILATTIKVVLTQKGAY